MSRSHKFHNPEGIYFVSFAVVFWFDVFTRREYKDILIDCLGYCQQNKGMEIYAFCIMTNHVHLIYKSTASIKPGEILRDFKRYTSNQLVKCIAENPKESRKELFLMSFKKAALNTSNVNKHQFWRHDNKPIELWSPSVIDEKINYIHQNPVIAGFVEQPHDYLYSSAKNYARELGVLNNVVCI